MLRRFVLRSSLAVQPSALLRLARRFKVETKDGVIPNKVVQHPYITGNKRYLPGFSFPAPRRLDQIVKYALLEKESPERIRQIWNEYHDGRLDSVATTWTEAEYNEIMQRKRRCPRFIFPVLKGDGKYFTLVCEWQDKYCILTFLDDYRKNPAAAEPYMSVVLYDELLPRKQLALVRADFSGHLRKADAVHILNQVRYQYLVEPKWVERFNLEPASFDFTAYLAEYPKPKEEGQVVDRDQSTALPATDGGVKPRWAR